MSDNPPIVDAVIAGSCADCRFVSLSKRPRIADATGFDDQLMFHDDDETVYTCKSLVRGVLNDKDATIPSYVGIEIGVLPRMKVDCFMWAEAEKKDLNALDKLMAKSAARAARGDREER